MGILDGKVAIVTGAGQGMGETDARSLAREGARVVLTDINDEAGREVAKAIGGAAHFVHHEITSEADWDGVIAATLERFGTLDVLVNNAGLFRAGSWEHESMQDFEKIMRVNVTGTWLGVKKAIAPMRAAGGGSIINLSSGAGLRGYANASCYGVSKWAVRGLTKYASVELAKYKIRVNSIHPGAIEDTGMFAASVLESEQTAKAMLAQVPLGRFGTRDDVAALVVFLASENSAYITGTEHVVDGGQTA